MKANTILNKVRELLGMEVQLATMMMKDGVTKVEAESFEADNEVVVVTEDEQKIPVPVGEYEMEDGTIMRVEEEGIIKEMKAKEEEAPEEAPAEEEAKKEYEDKEEKEEEMEASTPVKKTVESIVKETFFSEMEALKKENEELKAKLETLSKVENEEVTENVTETTTETIEEKTELSEEVAPIVWNPENKEQKNGFKFAKKGTKSTLEGIFEKFNK
jgi:primosomal protein N'